MKTLINQQNNKLFHSMCHAIRYYNLTSYKKFIHYSYENKRHWLFVLNTNDLLCNAIINYIEECNKITIQEYKKNPWYQNIFL